MKKPGPGDVIRSAIRLAAMPARNGVVGSLSLSKVCSTTVLTPVAGTSPITSFANDVIGDVPATGVNTVVLQTFDNDSDPTTPFLAGIAANLIADRITSPGPGFFIYFNSNLDLPRLVYSTDLSDNTADLKILARLTNLTGDTGRAAMPTFTEENFALAPTAIPEPATLSLMTLAGILSGTRYAR